MKYHLEIDVPEKPTIKGVNFKIPEAIYREFRHATQMQRATMTIVVIDMMRQFVNEYKAKVSQNNY